MTGYPTSARSGWYLSSTYLISGWYERLPVEALLDVRLLADDAGLEDREVAGLRRREPLGDEVLEVPVKPGSPGHVGHVAMARVTDVWNSRTWERSVASLSTLMSNAPVLPSRVGVAR